jgi:hypothetical protein
MTIHRVSARPNQRLNTFAGWTYGEACILTVLQSYSFAEINVTPDKPVRRSDHLHQILPLLVSCHF